MTIETLHPRSNTNQDGTHPTWCNPKLCLPQDDDLTMHRQRYVQAPLAGGRELFQIVQSDDEPVAFVDFPDGLMLDSVGILQMLSALAHAYEDITGDNPIAGLLQGSRPAC